MSAKNSEQLDRIEKHSLEGLEFYDENASLVSLKEWCKLSASPRKYYKETKVNGYHIISYWVGVDAPTSTELLDPKFTWYRWRPNKIPRIYQNILLDPDGNTVDHQRLPSKQMAYRLFATWKEKYEAE